MKSGEWANSLTEKVQYLNDIDFKTRSFWVFFIKNGSGHFNV